MLPCTPRGILYLLDQATSSLAGKVAVIVGRSQLVGNPLAQMLRQRDCTVIQCHSLTKELPYWIGQADILVAACGSPQLIQGDWLRPGVIVIDVGINFVRDIPSARKRIVGDVCFDQAQSRASAITPVPGGVGPMTIAMLLHNVVDAFERRMMRQRD